MCVCLRGGGVNLSTTTWCVHLEICALIHGVIYEIKLTIRIPWLGYCVNNNMNFF